MSRVLTLPALVCICASPACFNPPTTPLETESTTDAGTTTGDTTAPPGTTSVDPTTGPDPDTTAGPAESTTTDTGETTTATDPPEIEVSIDGAVIDAGGSFELVDTVDVDDVGPAVTITLTNVGADDLLVGGVLAVGPNASQVVIDQAGLAATIAGGDSSSFTASFAPTNGGRKDIVLRIGSNDDDENPFDLVLEGHTTENTYRLIPGAGGPVGRFNSALTDLGDGRLLMFGGRNAAGAWLNDTWIFEASTDTWTLLNPPASPPVRNAHGMARVDADTVVMFGGTAAGGGGAMGDTWLFEIPTATWSPLVPALGPPARFQHGMVAIGDARVLMYGGRVGAGAEMADTWIFDGASETWAPAGALGNPPTNSAFAFAFDRTDLVTMYGGFQSNNPLNQTWRYTVSTNTWANATPVGTPGARAVLSGEYLDLGRMIVFSGKLGDCCIDPTGGTFEYNPVANTWTTITPPGEPSPRFSYSMSGVAGANKAILFGGLLQNTGVGTALAETWEYVGVRP